MHDRTLSAVKRQLTTMRASQYDIGIYHRQNDKMSRRILDLDKVLKSLPWLKSQNFSDHDIYVRPNDSEGLIFFDDLTISSVEKMKSDGIQPCVVLQSSPQNYQGWIRVSNDPIDKAVATRICKLIAQRYQGDINSADWRHYGRLAGFTNRKREYINERGQYPFVLLNETNKTVSKENSDLVSAAIFSIKEEKASNFELIQQSLNYSGSSLEAENFYLEQIDNLRQRFGSEFDCSIADWWLVKSFAGQGVPKEAVREILVKNSPALETRRNNHASKYLEVTLEKAYSAI